MQATPCQGYKRQQKYQPPILIFLLFLCLPVLLKAQDTYTCNVQNQSLESVFASLEQAHDLQFSYASSSVTNQKVTADLQNVSLTNLLESLLTDVGLEYKIIDKNILVRKREDQLFENPEKEKNNFLVKGKITDEYNFPLELATVQISGTTIGTYTNTDGFFQLEIPAAYLANHLLISYIGYQKTEYQISEIKDELLLLNLKSGQVAINAIEVINREKPVRMLTREQSMSISNYLLTQTTSSLAGADIFRQLQLMPGVNATDDVSASIKIRGSNADETLIVLDGMPLYHSSHYYGIFSGVNASFIDEVSLYKNKLPSEYGGKTAGVVEMKSLDEISSTANGNIGINLLNADGVLNIPIHQKAMLSVSGRTTIGDISNSQFNTFAPQVNLSTEVDKFSDQIARNQYYPNFNFYDLNGKLLIQPDEETKLSLNFYNSHDELAGTNNRIIRNRDRQRFDFFNNENEVWNNTTASVNFQKNWANKFQLDTRVYFSRFENQGELNYDLYKREVGVIVDTLIDFGNALTNTIQDIGGEAMLKINLSKSNLTIGVALVNHDTDYKFVENKFTLLEGNENVLETAIFSEYDYHFNDRFTLSTGLRTTYYQGKENLYFSPRVALNYSLPANWQLKAAVGRYWQFVRMFNYDYRGTTRQFWVAATDSSIPVLRSDNFMLGFQKQMGSFILDVEGYYKNMSGVQEFALENPFQNNQNTQPRSYRLYEGDGYSAGVDIVLSKGFKFLDTYLSYTLSKTAYRFDEIARGDYLPSEDDRRHQLKWVNLFHYKQFDFGLDAIYATGLRYIDAREYNDGRNIRDVRNRYKTLPEYFRVDFGLGYNFKINNHTAKIRLSLFNAFNHQNVKYVKSVVSTFNNNQMPVNAVIGDESSLLLRTLNLEARWEF